MGKMMKKTIFSAVIEPNCKKAIQWNQYLILSEKRYLHVKKRCRGLTEVNKNADIFDILRLKFCFPLLTSVKHGQS